MKDKASKWSMVWLFLLLILAIFENFIANDRPYYCTLNGYTYYPIWHDISKGKSASFGNDDMNDIRLKNQWHTAAFTSAWYPPIPFAPGQNSQAYPVSLLPPGSLHKGYPDKFRHWLGTDAQGRDIAAGLVSGTRIALITGIGAMLIAVLIGLFMGVLAGYFGDQGLSTTRGRAFMTIIALPFAWFYGFTIHGDALTRAESTVSIFQCVMVFCAIILIFNQLGRGLQYIGFFAKRINIPADMLVMRLIEVKAAIPPLILVITLATLPSIGQSQWSIILIIGLLAWSSIARLVRGEFIKIKNLEYVEAARGLGLSDMAIVRKHILPNAMQPVLVAFTLGIGNAILAEVTLSFLGFGGKVLEGTTWGWLINAYRENSDAWWILLFPTLFMTLTLLSIYRLGEKTFS